MLFKSRCLFGLAILLVLAISTAHGRIALSSYLNERAITLPSDCQTCASPALRTVLGDDHTVTAFTYTLCPASPSSTFSLQVGVGTNRYTYFSVADCGNHLMLALDLSERTLAAQFYWDCRQAAIYKCAGSLVFDQSTSRCVPGGRLVYGETYQPTAGACETPQTTLPVSAYICESLLYRALSPVCSPCLRPHVQNVLYTNGQRSSIQYTFCADNSRFSLNVATGAQPQTFFAPDCRGKLLHPIDASMATLASKLFWDCRFGLSECVGKALFDPQANKCQPFAGKLSELPTRLENCPKTCGVVPPFPPPKPYAGPMSYAPPFSPARLPYPAPFSPARLPYPAPVSLRPSFYGAINYYGK